MNENSILFYKLYMLFNEQIKTHQIDSILGKLGDMDVSYDKFIDFINNEDEEFLWGREICIELNNLGHILLQKRQIFRYQNIFEKKSIVFLYIIKIKN